jgi:hypothetical protein
MKFLLFNLVVAGALVYLFTADRADVHMAADRVYETADEIKSVARNAVDQGRKLLQGDQAAAIPKPTPRALPRVQPQAIPRVEPQVQPQVQPRIQPQIRQKPIPEAAPVPAPVKQVARAGALAKVSPEVARRRDEVLGTANPESIPEIKQGEKFMSASQRQKELFSLAEEMELLYARKISQ